MKSLIVGTAGHIDHGKTALVRALTGIDADRLEEEKRRGITIDLGFAHMDLPRANDAAKGPATSDSEKNDPGKNGETLRIGFVDVPGHERFVRNMLAGVGGIDLVLLVIAADEGIKPQTREHFDILQLLGVRRGITVLTKADAVDAETLEVVRLEVQEFLRGTFLDNPKGDNAQSIVAVSSLTGAGLEELKRALVAAAGEVTARDSRALVRLPIDRVFTMKGFGTVVTGTLVAGTIRPEDELEVFPSGRRVRVRGVQVHGEAADAAVAGQRTALNLAGASTEDLARGMTLAPPETLRTTRVVDVKMRLLASAPRALKNRARVHFHSYTMETVAEVVFYTRSEVTPAAARTVGLEPPRYPTRIAPGEEMFVQLRLRDAALLLPGDRFIIRQFSPVVTIGGGSVVVNDAPLKIRDAGLHFDHLENRASPSREIALRSLVVGTGARGVSLKEAVARTGWRSSEVDSVASKVEGIVRIGDVLIWQKWVEMMIRKELFSHLESFHKNNPLVPGMSKEELRNQLPRIRPEVFDWVLEDSVRAKRMEILGELVRLPGHGVVMKDEEAESKKIIEAAFAGAGLKVPALQEVIAALKIDKARAQKIVTLLLRDRVLVKISDELVFHRSALDQLRRDLAAYKTKSAKVDVAKFKELTGVSRKYAIPLLEYLDRERVTRRVGDVREIL
jgi:selenocysteine-specific elongation factor